MEIEYSTKPIKLDVYGTYELIGLYDYTGNYIYKNFYDVLKAENKPYLSVKTYLKYYSTSKDYKLVKSLIQELDLPEEILKKKLGFLSESELIKVIVIKELLDNSKVFMLEHIDVCLNYKDMSNLCRIIKKYLPIQKKNAIVLTVKPETIISMCDRYMIAQNGNLTYNDKDFKKFPIKTDIMNFVDLANESGAKLDYYKDTDDLLKAIYRSVTK